MFSFNMSFLIEGEVFVEFFGEIGKLIKLEN